MPTKPYDKGSANDSVPALTDSGSVSYPVGAVAYGTEGGTVTIVGAAGLPVQAGSGASFPVTDGGGSLTVDGTVAVSGSVAVTGPLTDTQLRASAVPVSLTSTTITGTVAATQSGTWTVTGSGGTFPVTDSGGSLTVDAPVGTPVYVRLSDGTNPISTLPVQTSANMTGGATLDNDGPVMIIGARDSDSGISVILSGTSTGALFVTGSGGTFPVTDSGGSLTVDDGGGSLTVDGPLTDTQLRANPVQVIGPLGSSVPVNDNGLSLTVDTEGPSNPLYVRFSTGQSAVTQSSLDGITHSFGSDESFPSIASYIFGYDYGTSRHRPLFTNSSGNLVVTGTGGTFPVTDSGGSLTVDAPVGTPVFVRLSDGASAITTLPVSLASVPSHDVTNAGTFAVQVSSALPAGTNAIGKLAANSGVTIGAVEIAATQTLSTVTTVGTVTTVSTLTGGGVAHDGVDSGSPVKVGARAISSLASATMVSAADRTDAMSDLDGAWLVRSGFPLGDLTSERVSNTDGASTAFSNFGATASVRNYVTAITVYNSSATAGFVDFRDGTGGSVLFTVPIPAGSGAVVCNGGVPLFRTSANTALAYDVSAALTTVYISVSGFRSKV